MRYMLILLVLMFANVASAIDCDTAPTCEELGYSQDDDPYCADNGYMYCPLDRSYKKCVNMDCAKLGFTDSDKTSWCGKLIKCQGNPRMTLCQNLCEVGDVFYADGTCGYVDEYDPNDKNKIPVGVVVTVNAEGTHGKILALNDLTLQADYTFDEKNPFGGSVKEIPFGGYHYNRIGIHMYQWYNILSAFEDHDPWLWDGLSATKAAASITTISIPNTCQPEEEAGKIYHDKFCNETPGPTAAMAFYPEGVSADDAHLGKGKWYVPSLGEWIDAVGTGSTLTGGSNAIHYAHYKQIYFEKIKATLSALQEKNKAIPLADDDYYSSTFFDSRTFWVFKPKTQTSIIVWVNKSHRIRPMTSF